MTNEQLTATITNLEHALLDVWEWERLYNLGRLTAEVRGVEDLRPLRQMDKERTACLVTSYTKALDIVTDRLRDFERGPVADALLERLLENVLWKTGKGSFGTLLEQIDPGVVFDWETPNWQLKVGDHVEVDPTAGDFSGNWSHVEKDLAFYGSKVADHIRHYLTAEGQRAATATTERLRWNETAALLGYLFNELERLKYITPPQRKENGELKTNRAAVARILHSAFDIGKEGEEPVTLAALTQVFKIGGADYKKGPHQFKILPRTG